MEAAALAGNGVPEFTGLAGSEAPNGSAGSSPHRLPRVRSFDVFDTLIARRCVEPRGIFEQVGARAGIGNFVEARCLAEASVAHGPYDLAAIYAALATILAVSREQADALRDLEISLELENVIPVAENIAAVADGDILISDMYLGAEVIRRLLEAVGFRKKTALLVTSNGKHSGRIWPEVLAKFGISEHLGDNPHSDNAMPGRFGINSRHTAVAAPNVVEKTLFDIGLRDLASICREARLATWSEDAEIRALQVIQTSFNFPVLVLASVALARFAQRRNLCSILFSSRDCDLWMPLFRVVAENLGFEGSCSYFYTSRVTRTRPSPDYLKYARESIGPGSIVVDVCGTGWSLAHLFHRLGRRDQAVFLLHKLPAAGLYERQAPTPPTCQIEALVEGVEGRCNNMALEMCNYAEHGMVADVRRIASTSLPVLAPDPRSARTLALVAAQQRCCLAAVDILAKQGLEETPSLHDGALSALTTALYQGLSQQRALYATYSAQHLAEDRAVMTELGCMQVSLSS